MAEGSNNVVVPPLNLLLILKEESGVDLFGLSMKELRVQLLTGIILRDKKESTETQFFWMDEESNLSCFMLLPKSLRISADSDQVPRYFFEDEKRRTTGSGIPLPRVKYERVRHLKIGGKFCTMGLPGMGSEYEVVLFLRMLPTGGSKAVYTAITNKLSLPDGNHIQKPWERAVRYISTEEWCPFQVGTFRMSPNNVGELSFDIQVLFWGRPDILVKGVAIKPPSVK